mmetsp:Transcript_45801/g.115312  ORF Transcript_45801/g.115312 Transcript_45801/m.115312 type:complete len:315 (-) Transcript_45801:2-946(-)
MLVDYEDSDSDGDTARKASPPPSPPKLEEAKPGMKRKRTFVVPLSTEAVQDFKAELKARASAPSEEANEAAAPSMFGPVRSRISSFLPPPKNKTASSTSASALFAKNRKDTAEPVDKATKSHEVEVDSEKAGSDVENDPTDEEPPQEFAMPKITSTGFKVSLPPAAPIVEEESNQIADHDAESPADDAVPTVSMPLTDESVQWYPELDDIAAADERIADELAAPGVKVIDVNADVLRQKSDWQAPQNQKKAEFISQFRGGGGASSAQQPAKLLRRKNQITSLLFDARQKELEIWEAGASSRKSKAQVAARYGWK